MIICNPNLKGFYEFPDLKRAMIGFSAQTGITYDYEKILEVLQEDNGWDEEEAKEWFWYNTEPMTHYPRQPKIKYPEWMEEELDDG